MSNSCEKHLPRVDPLIDCFLKNELHKYHLCHDETAERFLFQLYNNGCSIGFYDVNFFSKRDFRRFIDKIKLNKNTFFELEDYSIGHTSIWLHIDGYIYATTYEFGVLHGQIRVKVNDKIICYLENIYENVNHQVCDDFSLDKYREYYNLFDPEYNYEDYRFEYLTNENNELVPIRVIDMTDEDFVNKQEEIFTFEELLEDVFNYCNTNQHIPDNTGGTYFDKSRIAWFSAQCKKINSTEDELYKKLSENKYIKEYLDAYLTDKCK